MFKSGSGHLSWNIQLNLIRRRFICIGNFQNKSLKVLCDSNSVQSQGSQSTHVQALGCLHTSCLLMSVQRGFIKHRKNYFSLPFHPKNDPMAVSERSSGWETDDGWWLLQQLMCPQVQAAIHPEHDEGLDLQCHHVNTLLFACFFSLYVHLQI